MLLWMVMLSLREDLSALLGLGNVVKTAKQQSNARATARALKRGILCVCFFFTFRGLQRERDKEEEGKQRRRRKAKAVRSRQVDNSAP
jgi:hypothetical protein